MAKKKSRSGSSDGSDQVDFETALAEVEQIVAHLESGDLELTESLEQYEKGVHQLKNCHAILDQAERKVSLLSGFDADGNPVTQPMPKDESAPSKSPDKRRAGNGGGAGKQGGAGKGSGARTKSVKRAQSGDDGGSGPLDASGPDSSRRSVDDSPGLF